MLTEDVGDGERLSLVSTPEPLPYRLNDDGTAEWRYCTWWAVLNDSETAPPWDEIAVSHDPRWEGPIWHSLRWTDRP